MKNSFVSQPIIQYVKHYNKYEGDETVSRSQSNNCRQIAITIDGAEWKEDIDETLTNILLVGIDPRMVAKYF